MKNPVLVTFLSLILSACQQTLSPSAQSGWAGHWTGVEGTYLDIRSQGNGYKLTISDLDGPVVFEGHDVKDGIAFTRNGRTETIRAGTGPDTGMKWLTEKKNCLFVHDGEGYCRS